jgi:hypothetical protein
MSDKFKVGDRVRVRGWGWRNGVYGILTKETPTFFNRIWWDVKTVSGDTIKQCETSLEVAPIADISNADTATSAGFVRIQNRWGRLYLERTYEASRPVAPKVVKVHHLITRSEMDLPVNLIERVEDLQNGTTLITSPSSYMGTFGVSESFDTIESMLRIMAVSSSTPSISSSSSNAMDNEKDAAKCP